MTNNTEQQAVPVAQEWYDAWITACARYNSFINRDSDSVFEAGWNAALASLPCKSGEGAGVPDGMKPWAGGDVAPVDWNGGPVLLRNGSTMFPSNVSLAYHANGTNRWNHQRENRNPDWDIIAYSAALTPDATQTREAEGPRLMSEGAKTGERVLVHFTGKGWLTVTWEDPYGDGDYKGWCVDDDKHGPYSLRGYNEGDDTHWMPLSALPALNARGGA